MRLTGRRPHGKNPDLCERAFCRERWTREVCGETNARAWRLHVCEDHARFYLGWLPSVVRVKYRSAVEP